jgi:outer membrane murein-binding lipoprotein Lpp
MPRQRAPYARRSVWTAVAVLAVVLVAGLVIAGYEINHLRNEVNGLQSKTDTLQASVTALYQAILNVAKAVPAK